MLKKKINIINFKQSEKYIMTEKEFLNSLSNGKQDILQKVLNLLQEMKIDYCLIGGLAVNAYAEPVVSLDIDLIIELIPVNKFLERIKEIFKVESFPHSLNLSSSESDLRIQIQTDKRYQDFIARSSEKQVMGYKMKVASLEDVMQGKVWAYMDKQRRESKRQKDLADIFRLVESYPDLKKLLPDKIKEKFRG
jgi:hypothetical protein